MRVLRRAGPKQRFLHQVGSYPDRTIRSPRSAGSGACNMQMTWSFLLWVSHDMEKSFNLKLLLYRFELMSSLKQI